MNLPIADTLHSYWPVSAMKFEPQPIEHTKGTGVNGTKLGATYFMPDASLAASVMVLAAA
jgi:hypothetical protein